jgi:DNA polymerase III epsilon subunit-like protein
MKILVIDIETTGFLNEGGEIVEIGIVELCLRTGGKKIIFDKVINPEIENEEIQNSWIVKNRYMTVEEIVNGFTFERIKDELQDIINKYPAGVTAFNRSFDIDFLKSYGIKFQILLPCPMKTSINVIKLPPTERMRMYRPEIKYKTPNAQEAYNFFYPGNYIEKHRGADDALHEADIIMALHRRNLFLT